MQTNLVTLAMRNLSEDPGRVVTLVIPAHVYIPSSIESEEKTIGSRLERWEGFTYHYVNPGYCSHECLQQRGNPEGNPPSRSTVGIKESLANNSVAAIWLSLDINSK